MQHVPGSPLNRIVAHMNSEVFLLMNEQQPIISVARFIKTHFPRLFVRKCAAHKEVAKIHLTPRLIIFLGCDAFAINGPQIGRSTTPLAHLGLWAEVVHKADNRQRTDDHPEPGLMPSNRSKHKLISMRTEQRSVPCGRGSNAKTKQQ